MSSCSRFGFLVLFAALGALPLRADKIILVAGGDEDRTGIPAARARLHEPFGVGFDRAGNMFIIEMGGNRLLKVDARGILHHVAGSSAAAAAGNAAPAVPGEFKGPHNLAVLPDGDVLVADTWNGRVLRFAPARGTVAAVPGFSTPAERARSNGPYCITLNPAGTQLFIADLRRIHAVDLETGQGRIVAGNGEKGVPADEAVATEAPLFDPRAVTVDRQGNVYILERGGHALRVMNPAGRIRTVVNVSGKRGADGDGADARHATMNGPKHLCVDRDDSILIADAENHLIRRYDPRTGRIERIAGTGKKGGNGVGGAPTECELNRPHGVTVHADGSLYIADSENHRILKIVR